MKIGLQLGRWILERDEDNRLLELFNEKESRKITFRCFIGEISDKDTWIADELAKTEFLENVPDFGQARRGFKSRGATVRILFDVEISMVAARGYQGTARVADFQRSTSIFR